MQASFDRNAAPSSAINSSFEYRSEPEPGRSVTTSRSRRIQIMATQPQRVVHFWHANPLDLMMCRAEIYLSAVEDLDNVTKA
jgi:hypothetical protein